MASVTRGKLRTYLGIAPGVGKTYAMLRDGRAAGRSGVDVVVAYLERHGRAATAAQLDALEVLPTRGTTYRGASFADLDVAGVIKRRPQLALVDELAHADLPGARHTKRWQDVDELLASGIAVHTTLNVSNLASLGALVSKITGVHEAEPVPDAFVRSGEVKLVNLEPAALRRRLAQGLVFPGQQADAALSHYFRFANLAALQELAQLWLDNVADPVEAYQRLHAVGPRGETTAVVVALAGSSADEWLIRYGANLAGLSAAQLRGVHVQVVDGSVRRNQAQLDNDGRLLHARNGSLIEFQANDVPSGLLRATHELGASQLVIGSPRGPRWSRRRRGSTVGRLLAEAGDLSVQVVNVGQPASGDRRRLHHHGGEWPRPPRRPR